MGLGELVALSNFQFVSCPFEKEKLSQSLDARPLAD